MGFGRLPVALALLAALPLGCSSDALGTANTVLLTLRFGPDVVPARIAALEALSIDVSGAEHFSLRQPVQHQFAHGEATIRYRPGVGLGQLNFTVAALDEAAAMIAAGGVSANLVPGGEVAVLVVLTAPSAGDGGVTDLAVDLAPPDLADLGGSDLFDAGVLDAKITADLAIPADSAGAPPDLAAAGDFALASDLAQAGDFATPDISASDLATGGDQAMAPPDLPPGDLAPPPVFYPSHVLSFHYRPNAGALSSSVATINTTTLTLYDANSAPLALPPGATFLNDGENAILSIGAWNITAPVNVVGMRRLVVVAAGGVVVSAAIHASATLGTPGPGGSPSNMGPGHGSSNQVFNSSKDPGGGGAGFGTSGERGGHAGSRQGGNGGISYGGQLSEWVGGSGGGAGSGFFGCTQRQGGGGGGAIQISSSIGVTVLVGGSIDANGGGGGGGCAKTWQASGTGGGGGGSGGDIFLEAPQMVVNGGLFANGGGGGAGADDSSGGTAGANGQDGLKAAAPALGGPGMNNGTSGGMGGYSNNGPTKGVDGDDNSGGGGGATGRIWLRTHNTPATVTGTVSSVQMTDTTL